MASAKPKAQRIRLAMVMDVPQRRRFRRRLRSSVVVLAACYVALLLSVQASERVMRHRSVRLLAEMRELQAGKSTWADLQGIRRKWGAWGNYDGTCTEERCDYTVSLTDILGDYRFAAVAFWMVHGRLASASLNVILEQRIVKRSSFNLWVEVPKGHGTRWEREEPQDPGYVPYSTGEYTLVAKASSVLDLQQLCFYWPNAVPHPNYLVTGPSGCEGCLAIWTEFLPQTSSAERLRLTAFNFDCITRWKPCADEEEIMPEVGAEYVQQRRWRTILYSRQEHCAYSVTELSKAALNAAVIRVESIPKEESISHELPKMKLRLIRRLGGQAAWNPDEVGSIDAFMQEGQGKLIEEAFRDRKPLIILYPQGPEANILLPYTCGVLPYSAEAEKDVAAGVSLGAGFPEWK